MKVEAARDADAAAVAALLAGAGLPAERLAAHLGDFVVVRQGGAVRGCAGMEIGGDSCLLRSLAVAPEWRGRGIGTALVQALVARAQGLGLRRAYAVTATAADFARRCGFVEMPRDELAAGLGWQLREEACRSAVVMRLDLSARVI